MEASADGESPTSQPPESEAPTSQPEGSERLGKTLAGRYLVEAVLGLGTMGVVYRCRHLVLDRAVAIKILRAELAQDQEVLQRFTTEAKAASSIGNSHIVEVLDFGRLADGSFYLVMEHLEGQTLGQLLHETPLLAAPVVLSIGRQIAEALAAAHQAGVVHRDLKPDNIFLTEIGGGTTS
jgi:serine/threonine-protein kinase